MHDIELKNAKRFAKIDTGQFLKCIFKNKE